MKDQSNSPRIILISQWPNIKNAEYELIERIRQTGFKITVVDYLGFDVATGRCINDATLSEEYDFAISFHYDTPKFLNIRTFLWVANPLEFMHLRGDYRSVLIHHLRSYDDYLYNGSGLLKDHIKLVVGSEWQDTWLEFFSSCSRKALFEPRLMAHNSSSLKKIFYCGVNWERITDKSGRSQGLFDILQKLEVVDFYGPSVFEGSNPWDGFSSYRGEIPFDGISLQRKMQDYTAVLAISSPAHIKSRTSSGRVFEGFSAGVPVISDENPHVRQLFGDLVYYFSGTTDEDRANAILSALEHISSNPEEAGERVRKAQAKISENYCYEATLTRVFAAVTDSWPVGSPSATSETPGGPIVDVFLFHHDPYAGSHGVVSTFSNIPYIAKAVSVVMDNLNAHIRLFCYAPDKILNCEPMLATSNFEWIPLSEEQIKVADWEKMRLGEKVSRLAGFSTGDFAVFLTQFDYPHYDYFLKPLNWFLSRDHTDQKVIYLGGFFANNLAAKAPGSHAGILRNNASVGLYRWTQDSIAQHQLGQFCFSRQAMKSFDFERISHFDVLLPVAIISEAVAKKITLYRARHLLLRVVTGYFHRHFNAYQQAVGRGFWAQHYELVSNYTHELNALYDTFNESPDVIEIAEKVTGRNLPPVAPVNPAVYAVNQFIDRLRPLYRFIEKIRTIFGGRRA